MTLGDDDVTPTYDGPFEFRPDLPGAPIGDPARAFEGVISWYIGYDGPGCVTLVSDRAA